MGHVTVNPVFDYFPISTPLRYRIMATLEPRTVGDKPPNPESHLVATEVVNPSIEVKQHVQGPGDTEPSMPGNAVVRSPFHLHPTIPADHLYNIDDVGVSYHLGARIDLM